MGLLLAAAFGFFVPNGFFIYWLVYEYRGPEPVLRDNLALGFMLDVTVTLIILTVYFAKHPIGRVGWPWFVLLSFMGGLGFSLPLYYWLNRRSASPTVDAPRSRGFENSAAPTAAAEARSAGNRSPRLPTGS